MSQLEICLKHCLLVAGSYRFKSGLIHFHPGIRHIEDPMDCEHGDPIRETTKNKFIFVPQAPHLAVGYADGTLMVLDASPLVEAGAAGSCPPLPDICGPTFPPQVAASHKTSHWPQRQVRW